MADRTVKVTLIANAAGFVRGMDEARKKTRETTQDAKASLAEQEAAYTELGHTALAVGTLAAAGALLAISKYAQFDQAMSEVQASTHESASNMGLLRDAAIEAGSSTVFTATEAAGAIDELAKAGISTADVLGGALAGSLDLASAGGLGVADAAAIAATAMTQFNIAGSEVPHIADLLAAGAGKAQGSVQDLAAALNQGGLVASQAGFSIEETTGTLAAFASAGLLGSDAGTSLKTAILALQKPSAAAAETMKQYGISVYDSNGSMLSFSEIAGQLQSSLGGLTEEQRNSALATIFGTDAVRSAGVLYAQGAEGIAAWEAKVNDSGYAAETARLKLDNLNGDLEKLGGAFDTGLIKSGSAANDVLRSLTQGATALVDNIASLPEPVLAVGLGLTALVGAAGLAGGGFLTLVPKIAATKLAMESLNLTGKSLAIGLAKGGVLGLALTSVASGFAGLGQNAELSEIQIAKLNATMKNVNLYNLNEQFDTGQRGASGFAAALEQLGTSDFSKSERANLEIGRFVRKASFGLSDLGHQLDDTNSQFLQIGETLASLAQTDFKAADDQFQSLAKAAGGGKEVYEQLLGVMPAYKAQLIEMAGAAGGATDDQSILNIAMQQGATYTQIMRDATAKNISTLDELAGVAGDTRQSVSDLADQIRNFGSAQFDAESAAIAFQQSLADLVEATAEGTGSLDITTDAGRRTRSALLDVASSANEYAAAQLSTGASTAAIQGTLDAGRNQIIATRIALGDSAQAAQAYADKLIATPQQISTAIVLNGVQLAQSQIDRLIQVNQGRSIDILVNASNPKIGFGLGDGHADGGAIYGPGGPRDDRIPAMLSNGEHVLTASDVQAMGGQQGVYRFRSALHGFADGGEVAPRFTAAPRGRYATAGSAAAAPSFNVVVSAKGGVDLLQYVDVRVEQASSDRGTALSAGKQKLAF